MAYPQRPQYGRQQYPSAQQDSWPSQPDHQLSQSSTIFSSSLSNYSHQPIPNEQDHQNGYYAVRSYSEFSHDQTVNRAQWNQEPAAPHQVKHYNTEPRFSERNRQYQAQDHNVPHQDPQPLSSHAGHMRQEKLQYPSPRPGPLQRSYSHDVALGTGQPQYFSNNQDRLPGKSVKQEPSSVANRSRHHQPVGNSVEVSGEHRGRSVKKPEKQRIIIEPSSPDTISWDNPFPTFPTNKKKVIPADRTETRSSPARGSQNQRPSTAGSGRTSNETSRGNDSQRNLGPEDQSLRQRKGSDERGPGSVYKQNVNGNYSLPLSSLATSFTPEPSSVDAMANDYQEYSINHKVTPPKQTHSPSPKKQQSFQRAGFNQVATGVGTLSNELNVVGKSRYTGPFLDGTDQNLNHAYTQRQGHYNSSFPSQQDSYSGLIPSYYEEQTPIRQNLDRSAVRAQSPVEEDMPDFSVLSLSDNPSLNRPTEDLHLQSAFGIPVDPILTASSLVERGRGVLQEPRREFAKLVQRSRSQPNYRNPSQSEENHIKEFDFGTNGNSHEYDLSMRQTTHLPISRPAYSQREPSTDTNYSARSAPTATPSQFSSQSVRVDRHSDTTRRPSPVIGPGLPSNRAPHSIRSQRPHDRVFTDQNIVESTDRTMQPSSHSLGGFSSHPAPVRPGLLNQAAKPPPIRQYNNRASPLSQTSSPPPPLSINPQHKRAPSNSLTQADIGSLRQAVQVNPNDMKAQLALAKKMVEISSTLADQDGQADPKQRAKNREKSILDAYKMVKKLVHSGYVEAMFYLADCYGRGLLGLETDPKEAFNLYSSAAKLGHAASAYRVAVCCEMGQDEGGGTRRDPLKAVQWYKRAATLGDTPAMYKVGMIQLKGLLGQPRNPREAIVWLKRAAERSDEENPHALHELGLLFESAGKNDNIIRDEAYSLQLFTQAATLGYKFSQHRLGAAYEYGSLGCVIDARQSIAWYSKAAVQEEHQSELALSGWYLTGSEGILQQSDTEAYLWARKAAHAGLAKAEYAMGYFTEVGIGAPANLEDAKRWYWRAASQNFPKARERLEDLRKGGARMEKSRVSRSAVNKGSDGDCLVM